MSRQPTPAQMAIIDETWDRCNRYKLNKGGRIPKRHITMATVRCWDVGPVENVSAQAIGRIFAERQARAENRPRAMAKTPEQLEILRELYDEDPYPYPGEMILATYDTGLEAKQVKAWFENERKKAEKKGELYSNRLPNEMFGTANVAAKMWRAYKKDPEGYAEALRAGHVDSETGERLVEDEDDG